MVTSTTAAPDQEFCAIARTLDVLRERWALLILRDAFNGVRRFDDLRRSTGAPRQVLSGRLAHLVDQGLLDRVPYQEPGQRIRHEYRLTASGRDLYPVFLAMFRWGDRHRPVPPGTGYDLTHRDCGEPVDVVLRCAGGHELDSVREVERIEP